MKKEIVKHISKVLSWAMIITAAIGSTVIVPAEESQTVANLTLREAYGYEEGACIEWEDAEYYGYNAYVRKTGDTDWQQLEDCLIRRYAGFWRADCVGLKSGESYDLKAVPLDEYGNEVSAGSVVASNLSVSAYDRSGAAFSTTSPLKKAGAYNEDGTTDALVIYVTPDTAKTVKADIMTESGYRECTGFQTILDALQEGKETRPVDFRIVGTVRAEDMDKFSSSEEGLQIRGTSSYAPLNITIEGIGKDAAFHGFGLMIKNCGSVEVRNLGILNCMDDAVSVDGNNSNIWIHDMDFFYGQPGSDSDQAKGDGTVDIKNGSTYVTVSYNHFWDNGKSSLCGMKSESESYFISYHHNHFDHSDSRHPRLRTMSSHIYNNYFDGNSKYGVGVTMGASVFAEENYFRHVKATNHPLMSSQQGCDALGSGTFSGENGGIIKSYNNIFEGGGAVYDQNNPATTGIDCYTVTDRYEKVPSDVVTRAGGTAYNNFDTSTDVDMNADIIDKAEDVPSVVKAKAGRLGGGDLVWTFNDEADDTSSSVNTYLQKAVQDYVTPIISIGGKSDGIKTETTTAATQQSSQTTTEATTEATTRDIDITPLPLTSIGGQTPEDAQPQVGQILVTYRPDSDTWLLNDKSTIASATLTHSFESVTSGKVVVYGYATPQISRGTSKWAFLQVKGTDLSGGETDIVSIASDTEKIVSARTNSSTAEAPTYVNFPTLGEVAKKQYNYTIAIDMDAQTATVTVNDEEVTVPIQAKDVHAVYSVTAVSAADRNLIVSTPVVGLMNEGNSEDMLFGDADLDGMLTSADVTELLQYVLTEEYMIIQGKTKDYEKWLDVNKDGSLTSGDCTHILQKTLDSTYVFPVEK